MRKIFRPKDPPSQTFATPTGNNAQRQRPTKRPPRDEGIRRNSLSTSVDILSHIQELKDKERQVLSRNTHDTLSKHQQQQPLNAQEERSRQERQAREGKLAAQYRDQLKDRLQMINDTAIDLGLQKTKMAKFERMLQGAASARETELLEIDRINGVRSLVGIPPLPPPPVSTTVASGSASGMRGSPRPGTPIHAASSPAHIPSPSYSSHASYRHQQQRRPAPPSHHASRHTASHPPPLPVLSKPGNTMRRHQPEDDDEEQDMDLEEGEISEEGELLE